MSKHQLTTPYRIDHGLLEKKHTDITLNIVSYRKQRLRDQKSLFIDLNNGTNYGNCKAIQRILTFDQGNQRYPSRKDLFINLKGDHKNNCSTIQKLLTVNPTNHRYINSYESFE